MKPFESKDLGLSFSSSNPIGSVHKPRTIHVSDLPPINPDHVGGFKVAAATFAGVEHKFGLALPKFNTSMIRTYVPMDVANARLSSAQSLKNMFDFLNCFK